MNRTELEAILPHRAPMLLLDEAEVVDEEAHGRITITGDEFMTLLKRENPLMPPKPTA